MADGCACPVDEVIRLALSFQAPDAVRSSAVSGGPLTRRQHEVAALIARGLSNRQIAAELVITERTAAAHIEHILDKLGFSSRTQIAVWAAASPGLLTAGAPLKSGGRAAIERPSLARRLSCMDWALSSPRRWVILPILRNVGSLADDLTRDRP